MTRHVGDRLIIEEEEPSICQVCGDLAELRPYGINGEEICYNCGKKNQEQVTKRMFQDLFGMKTPKGFNEENSM